MLEKLNIFILGWRKMMQLIGSYLITFYNIYNRSSNMAPPNWDDDFDFDDLDDQPKKKQP